MPLLQLCHISKSFAHTPAVADINLTLNEGQILCLLGPSGCGKTTLLRLMAGLELPDRGTILFEGQDISRVSPHQRGFGLMFQEFALFPHKNIAQNVAFGLQMKRMPDITQRVQEMLDLVGLTGFEDRDVHRLSGGERQRVALARSLAPQPRLLLLDEPLGALDRAMRERLIVEIYRILKRLGLTTIYVTHDQAEAFAMADWVIVMNQGRIEQQATPEQLYRQPQTPFVAQFLGFTNLLQARCLDANQIETKLGIWPVSTGNYAVGTEVTALIRPEAAALTPTPGIPLTGELMAALFRGRFYQITILIGGEQLTFEVPPTKLPPLQSQVTLWLDPSAIWLLSIDKN